MMGERTLISGLSALSLMFYVLVNGKGDMLKFWVMLIFRKGIGEFLDYVKLEMLSLFYSIWLSKIGKREYFAVNGMVKTEF